MKGAVLVEQNKPLQIMSFKRKMILDVGQVLVDIHASGICGAQLGEISGAAGYDPYLPHLLGHEGSGVVRSIGPGVRTVAPGDHVVLHWRKGSGIEATPPTYETSSGLSVGAGLIATFADQSIISENRMTKIGNDIPFDVAALMGCAVTTGLGIISNEAQLKIGQDIAVAGVGGVGLNVIQGAALAGANNIIAIDLELSKIQFAHKFGATSGPIPNHVGSVDVFVDCTGVSSVIDRGMRSLRAGGRMILVGQPVEGKDLHLIDMRQHYKGKTILDSQGGLTNPDVDIPRYLDLYRSGKLKLNPLITSRCSLADINDALKLMKDGAILGRCIVEMV